MVNVIYITSMASKDIQEYMCIYKHNKLIDQIQSKIENIGHENN